VVFIYNKKIRNLQMMFVSLRKEEKKESQMKMKERTRKVKQNPKNECVKLK